MVPATAEAYFKRANAHIKQGNYGQPSPTMTRRFVSHPDYPTPTLTGAYLRAARQLLAAIADFSEVIRLDPDNTEAYFDRGCLYSEQGRKTCGRPTSMNIFG